MFKKTFLSSLFQLWILEIFTLCSLLSILFTDPLPTNKLLPQYKFKERKSALKKRRPTHFFVLSVVEEDKIHFFKQVGNRGKYNHINLMNIQWYLGSEWN